VVRRPGARVVQRILPPSSGHALHLDCYRECLFRQRHNHAVARARYNRHVQDSWCGPET
jgi:hypothetical protein